MIKILVIIDRYIIGIAMVVNQRNIKKCKTIDRYNERKYDNLVSANSTKVTLMI